MHAQVVAQTRALPSFTGAIRLLTTFMFASLLIYQHNSLIIWYLGSQFGLKPNG
jgi:hypothetical protein